MSAQRACMQISDQTSSPWIQYRKRRDAARVSTTQEVFQHPTSSDYLHEQPKRSFKQADLHRIDLLDSLKDEKVRNCRSIQLCGN